MLISADSQRWHTAETVVWLLGVVEVDPILRKQLDLLGGLEQILIEHFVAIGPIEAFDERILVGLAGLDVEQRDLMIRTPALEALGGELRTVV